MSIEYIWSMVVVILIFVMLFMNKKVRVFPVLVEQLQVFKNDKTKKFSPWDFLCFIFMPIVIAFIIAFKLNAVIDRELASTLTTVFSLVFTILFGFATILIGKIDSENSIEKQVVGETFVSIVSATLLALISAILSIILIIVHSTVVIEILTFVLLAVSFMIIMLLLLIIKRTYIVYDDLGK